MYGSGDRRACKATNRERRQRGGARGSGIGDRETVGMVEREREKERETGGGSATVAGM